MFIIIEIGNSYSQVKGMTPEVYSGLRKLLSYSPNASTAHYTGGFVRIKYLIDKQGFFPTGLLARVKAHLKVFTTKDLRVLPMRHPFHPSDSAYPWQNAATKTGLELTRGIISAVTGSGKSRVIRMLAEISGLRTLVVVPSVEIKYQLRDALKGLTNVTIQNIDSPLLKKPGNFDCLILDEAHHSASKTYQDLNKKAWKDIYYRYFITATPFRNQQDEQLLFEGIAGQVIYQLDYPTAVSKGYICPIEAYYYDLPKLPVNGTTWNSVYNELVVHNEYRNNLISALLLRLNSAGQATLCLVKEVAHGEALAKLTGLPFTHGQDEESRDYIRQFKSGEIKALIGTEGVLGEGIDLKPCEYVVIAGLGKAKSSLMQKIGRVIRTYPGKESGKVILFRDKSHKWTLAHFNAQKKICLDEYQVLPIKLEI